MIENYTYRAKGVDYIIYDNNVIVKNFILEDSIVSNLSILAKFKYLTSIKLSNIRKTTDLSVLTKLTTLKKIEFSDCKITNIPYAENVKDIYIKRCCVKRVDKRYNGRLKINFSYNKIRKINFPGVFIYNRIKTLKHCSEITEIDYNKIKDFSHAHYKINRFTKNRYLNKVIHV